MTAELNFPEEMTLEEAQRISHAMKELVASDGWKYYCSLVMQQQKTRLDHYLLVPLATLDSALEQEFSKGEIAGMRTAIAMPENIISDCAEIAEAVRRKETKDEAE